MTYLCIRPACGAQCSDCNMAISPQQQRDYAIRYAWLLMLLSTPGGKPVTLGTLRYHWDKARHQAACKAYLANEDDTARAIKAMYLRDARKRAAQKSASLEAASELLQHDDKRLTERHYGGVRRLKPVA